MSDRHGSRRSCGLSKWDEIAYLLVPEVLKFYDCRKNLVSRPRRQERGEARPFGGEMAPPIRVMVICTRARQRLAAPDSARVAPDSDAPWCWLGCGVLARSCRGGAAVRPSVLQPGAMSGCPGRPRSECRPVAGQPVRQAAPPHAPDDPYRQRPRMAATPRASRLETGRSSSRWAASRRICGTPQVHPRYTPGTPQVHPGTPQGHHTLGRLSRQAEERQARRFISSLLKEAKPECLTAKRLLHRGTLDDRRRAPQRADPRSQRGIVRI